MSYFKGGTIDGFVNCTYYLGPVGFGTAFSTVTANGSVLARNYGYSYAHVDSYPASWSNGGTTAVCTLSGKMTLGLFYVVEYGQTNVP